MERSGLLNPNMFDDGNEIMADKGFNIRDLTDNLTCQFFLDPGVNLKLMKIEKKNNRIHVERFINKVKKFLLLNRTVPLSLH